MSAALQTAEPVWLRELRATAQARFHGLGLPSAKTESWRFTNLRAFAARPEEGLAALTLKGNPPAGVRFCTFQSLLATAPERLAALLDQAEAPDAFAALNLARFHDGYVLDIAPGVQLDAPLELIHTNQGGAAHLRGIVRLGAGASATLAEHHQGSGWTSSVTSAALAEGARLRHVKRQTLSPNATYLSALTLTLGAAADHSSVILSLGAAVAREAITARLEGEGARFSLRGAYLLGGRQQASFVPEVHHFARGCTSRQSVKGVLGGEAHGIFLGHIGVPQGSDGTDAAQTNRNLLLSPGARVDTRPRLEILADDVKCSHGATVGDLDETAAFYLQSRGIPPQEARRMLIEAFAAEIVEEADLPAPLRATLQETLSTWAALLP